MNKVRDELYVQSIRKISIARARELVNVKEAKRRVSLATKERFRRLYLLSVGAEGLSR